MSDVDDSDQLPPLPPVPAWLSRAHTTTDGLDGLAQYTTPDIWWARHVCVLALRSALFLGDAAEGSPGASSRESWRAAARELARVLIRDMTTGDADVLRTLLGEWASGLPGHRPRGSTEDDAQP